jgi:endoglycosylceramidase
MRDIDILTLLLLCLLCGCISAGISVDPVTSYLVDETGRFVFYHGVNAVYKEPPFHPKTDSFDPNTSLAREDLTRLREWGLRAVRMGVVW